MLKKKICIIIISIFLLTSVTSLSAMGISCKAKIINTQVSKSASFLSNEKTLFVGGTGDNNYSTIQEAIDDASTGYTVYVYGGTYYEQVNVDKAIHLMGENRDNTIIDGMQEGVVVNISADLVSISGFTIQNSGSYYRNAGIAIHSNYNSISANKISNNLVDGVNLYHSDNNIISNNIISDNFQVGIRLSNKCCYNNISDNIISDSQYGIEFVGKSNYNIATGNIISSDHRANQAGIMIYSSNNNTISDNEILNNVGSGVGSGIIVWGGRDSIISGNTISMNSEYGIMIESYGAIISGNTITMNGKDGLFFMLGKNNTISGNTISMNGRDGIRFGEFDLHLYNAVINSTISGNTISMNDDKGMCFIGSNNNTIFKNNISNNDYGIYLKVGIGYDWEESYRYPSSDNIIYFNNFIDNDQNAFDECDNDWNNFDQGNFWDDYEGKDILPPYGIGDSPYEIPGEGNNIDEYPLMKPYPNVKSRTQNKLLTNTLFLRFLERLVNAFSLLDNVFEL